MNNSSATKLVEQGTSSLRAGNARDSRRLFERAVEIDPEYFEAQFGLGLVTLARGEVDVAARAFSHALGLAP